MTRHRAVERNQSPVLEDLLAPREVEGTDAQVATARVGQQHARGIGPHDAPRGRHHRAQHLGQIQVGHHTIRQLEQEHEPILLVLQLRMAERIVEGHRHLIGDTGEEPHVTLRIGVGSAGRDVQAAEPSVCRGERKGARRLKPALAQESLRIQELRVLFQPRNHRGPLVLEDPRRLHGLDGNLARRRQRQARLILTGGHIPRRAPRDGPVQEEAHVVEIQNWLERAGEHPYELLQVAVNSQGIEDSVRHLAPRSAVWRSVCWPFLGPRRESKTLQRRSGERAVMDWWKNGVRPGPEQKQ